MSDANTERVIRRHRRPSDAQLDERFKLEGDPEDALRVLLGVKPEDSPESDD